MLYLLWSKSAQGYVAPSSDDGFRYTPYLRKAEWYPTEKAARDESVDDERPVPAYSR